PPANRDRSRRLHVLEVAIALDLHQGRGEAAASDGEPPRLGQVADDLDLLLVEPIGGEPDLDLDLLAGAPTLIVDVVDQEPAERPVDGGETPAADHDGQLRIAP